MEKREGRKSVKFGAAAAILVLLAAGVSVYATSTNGGAAASISEAEAKQIALAEVKGADTSHITKCKQDQDDGRSEYDIEIIYGGYEYDFEISAKDGKIFDQNKEKADAEDLAKVEKKAEAAETKTDQQNASEKTVVTEQSKTSSSSSSGISLDRAKSIALGQVSGASSGNITKAYKDYDDGRAEYDIEIRYNGYEYDFEISASSGKILSKDVDRIESDDKYDDKYEDKYDDYDDRYDDYDDRYDD